MGKKYADKFENWIYDFDVHYKRIKNLCYEALDYGFPSVSVFPSTIWIAKQVLRDTDKVKIAAFSSYPHGGMTIDMKVFEIADLIKEGADEINCVLNIRMATDDNWDYVKRELDAIRKAAQDKVLKVYLENNFLNDQRIGKLAELSADAGVDWVIDCHGKGVKYVDEEGMEHPLLATVKDYQVIRSAVGEKCKVMMQLNIDTPELALELINAGVDRIASRHAVEICDALNA